MKAKVVQLMVAAAICWGAAATATAGEMTADEIVRRANHMALYQGRSLKGKVALTIRDKAGHIRQRTFTMLRKNDDDRDRDQKYYVYFQTPADVRKMAFMVYKHAALESDDDRWLYLPGLDLVKRIAASDKRTSFAGSDFLYEDISGRSPEEDVHTLESTEDTRYVLKNVPKAAGTVEFAYYLAHIDRQTFLPMKMEFFKADGRCYRVIEVTRVETIEASGDGGTQSFPTVVQSVARDLESGSETEMTTSGLSYNVGLDDGLFSERYLRRPPREAMR